MWNLPPFLALFVPAGGRSLEEIGSNIELRRVVSPPKHEPITVLVVLPAYNEEECLETLLRRIDEAMFDGRLQYRCLVVDDGSTDGTREVLEECRPHYPLTIIHHQKNKGLGATIRTGLTEAVAIAGERDIIVTMDADDTHAPGLIARMVRLIGEGYDVVIASRFQSNAQVRGVPWFRHILSFCASMVFRIMFPTPGVRDYTCGYRAYRSTVLKTAFERHGNQFLKQDGFQCMVDILLWMRQMDAVIGETPMILRYDLKGGESKMDVGRTIRNTLKLAFKRRFSS